MKDVVNNIEISNEEARDLLISEILCAKAEIQDLIDGGMEVRRALSVLLDMRCALPRKIKRKIEFAFHLFEDEK
jgi:hypothetical protein